MSRLIEPLVESLNKSGKLIHPFLILNGSHIYLNDISLPISINAEVEFITRERIRLFIVEKLATDQSLRRIIDLKSISFVVDEENCLLSTKDNSYNEIGVLNLTNYKLILFKKFTNTQDDLTLNLELKYSYDSYLERIMRRNYNEN